MTTIAGHSYTIGELNAFEQLHVARRLAPVLAGIVSAFSSAPHLSKGESAEEKILELATGPLANAFAQMSDVDVDYIVHRCLAVCHRKRAGGQDKVFANGVLMFKDIKLDTLMGLTLAVIQENLGSFFPTGQPTSGEAK
jgi:hypothetical protein